MARKDGEYKFRIDAYSLETLPMSRLAEYMADLAALLGEPHSVHFVRLEPGSAVMVQQIDKEAIPKVDFRVRSVAAGEADEDVIDAYDRIDRRLSEDNAIGELISDRDNGGVIVNFPGRERPKPADYGAVVQQGSLDGVMVSIGGKGSTAHIILQDGDHIYSNIVTNREVGRKLAPHMWARTLRVHGEGRWRRGPDGEWELRRFRLESFDVLNDAPLVDAVEALRKIPDTGWAGVDAPAEVLQDLRRDPNDKSH